MTNNHIDIGAGMTYCKKHMCWFQFGEHCIKCEEEQITKTKSVKIENEMSI